MKRIQRAATRPLDCTVFFLFGSKWGVGRVRYSKGVWIAFRRASELTSRRSNPVLHNLQDRLIILPSASISGKMLDRPAGGRGGIRTHGGLSPTAVFKTAALNHSATHP